MIRHTSLRRHAGTNGQRKELSLFGADPKVQRGFFMKSSVATSDDVIRNLGIAGTFFCSALWLVWVFSSAGLGSCNHQTDFSFNSITPCLTP